MRHHSVRNTAGTLALVLAISACTAQGATEDTAPEKTTLEVSFYTEPPELGPSLATDRSAVVNAMLMPIMMNGAEKELHSDSLDSWEVAEDGSGITLNLREGIQWNDGTPLTSADLIRTLTYYLDPTVAPYTAGALRGVVGVSDFAEGKSETISGLTALDDYTVEIELSGPIPWLAALAAWQIPIWPAHVLGESTNGEWEDHEYFRTFNVTNGPYDFVKWSAGQYVEFKRNDAWSLGEAGFERLFIKFVQQDAAAAQLQNRELQLISEINPVDVERIGALDGIEIQSNVGALQSAWTLMPDGRLKDPRVRQAMLFAVDRQGICEQLLQGNCHVSETNMPNIGAEWAYPTDDVIEYDYDPDRARELLEEAEWDPNIELTFLNWRPDDPVHAIVQGNLADVGINFKIENIEVATLVDRLINSPGGIDAFAATTPGFVSDPGFLRTYLSCDYFVPNGSNRSSYCNEEFSRLMDVGHAETDPDTRAKTYQEAFRIFNSDVPIMHVVVSDTIIAHDTRLKGVVVRTESHQNWNIGEWYWEE